MTLSAAATRPRKWTEGDLRFLLENAGRVPVEKLCRGLRRDRAEVEDVAARVRATGYPIGLTVETCPMCGSRAPIVYNLGICLPCSRRRAYENTQRQISEILPLLAPEDRATYEDTEADCGCRALDAMPEPTGRPTSGATPAELMAYEEGRCAQVAEWEARQIQRRVKAAQKRKERIALKARARGAEIPASAHRTRAPRMQPLASA